ncbi:MAG: hypothetical protein ACYC51_05335 [Thermoleophilia bacterium]
MKHNFFQRYRSFDSLEEANNLALMWLKNEADPRLHGTVKEIIAVRFERERPHLTQLPQVRFDTSYRKRRLVGLTATSTFWATVTRCPTTTGAGK